MMIACTAAAAAGPAVLPATLLGAQLQLGGGYTSKAGDGRTGFVQVCRLCSKISKLTKEPWARELVRRVAVGLGLGQRGSRRARALA
jgi:hypothetical protein